MKKILSTILFCTVLLAGMIPLALADDVVTVTWWTWATDATPAYRAIVDGFEAANPDVKIDLLFISNAEYWSKMPIAIASGTGPDIYQMTRPSYELYAASGRALNLTDIVANSTTLQDNLSQMDPTLVDSYMFEGKLMAIPYTVEATCIAYNKTLFKQAGLPDLKGIEATWTWSDLEEIANQLTVRDASGNTTQYGFLVPADRLPTWEMIWAHGCELFNETKDVCILGEAGVAEALQPLVDMYQAGVSPSVEATATMTADDMFMSGRIAMIGAGIWKMPTYRGITGFEWDVVELPFDETTGKRVSSSNVLGFVINPNSKVIDATVRFLEYATSAEGQSCLSDNHIYIPANVNVRDSYFEGETVPENISAYQRALDYLHPNTLTQYIIYEEFTQLYMDALRLAYRGDATIAEAMIQLQDKINDIMEENKANFE